MKAKDCIKFKLNRRHCIFCKNIKVNWESEDTPREVDIE